MFFPLLIVCVSDSNQAEEAANRAKSGHPVESGGSAEAVSTVEETPPNGVLFNVWEPLPFLVLVTICYPKKMLDNVFPLICPCFEPLRDFRGYTRKFWTQDSWWDQENTGWDQGGWYGKSHVWWHPAWYSQPYPFQRGQKVPKQICFHHFQKSFSNSMVKIDQVKKTCLFNVSPWWCSTLYRNGWRCKMPNCLGHPPVQRILPARLHHNRAQRNQRKRPHLWQHRASVRVKLFPGMPSIRGFVVCLPQGVMEHTLLAQTLLSSIKLGDLIVKNFWWCLRSATTTRTGFVENS